MPYTPPPRPDRPNQRVQRTRATLARTPSHHPEKPPRWYVVVHGTFHRIPEDICWKLESHYNLDAPETGKAQEIIPQDAERDSGWAPRPQTVARITLGVVFIVILVLSVLFLSWGGG